MRFFRIPAFTGIETHRDDADRGSLRVVEGCVPHGPGGLRSGPVWEKVGDVDLFSDSDNSQSHMTGSDDGKGNSIVYVSRAGDVHDMAVFSTENTDIVSLGSTYAVAAPTLYNQEAAITPIGNRLYAMGDGTAEAAYIGKGPPAATASVFPDEMLYDQEWSRFPSCKFYVQGPKKTIFAAGNPNKPLTVYISEPAGLTNPYRDSPHSTELTNHNAGVLSTVDILSSNASVITALSTRGDQVVVHTDKGCHLLYAPQSDQASTGYRTEQTPATNFSGAVNVQVVAGESGTQPFWLGHDGQIYKDEAASRGAEDYKSYTDPKQASWKAKGQWEKELPVDLSGSFATYDPLSGMYWIYVESDEYKDFIKDEMPNAPFHLRAVAEPVLAPINLVAEAETVQAPINLNAEAETVQAPINLNAKSPVIAPINLNAVANAVQAPINLNAEAETVQAPINLNAEAETVQAPINLHAEAETVQAPINLNAEAETVRAPINLHAEKTCCAAQSDWETLIKFEMFSKDRVFNTDLKTTRNGLTYWAVHQGEFHFTPVDNGNGCFNTATSFKNDNIPSQSGGTAWDTNGPGAANGWWSFEDPEPTCTLDEDCNPLYDFTTFVHNHASDITKDTSGEIVTLDFVFRWGPDLEYTPQAPVNVTATADAVEKPINLNAEAELFSAYRHDTNPDPAPIYATFSSYSLTTFGPQVQTEEFHFRDSSTGAHKNKALPVEIADIFTLEWIGSMRRARYWFPDNNSFLGPKKFMDETGEDDYYNWWVEMSWGGLRDSSDFAVVGNNFGYAWNENITGQYPSWYIKSRNSNSGDDVRWWWFMADPDGTYRIHKFTGEAMGITRTFSPNGLPGMSFIWSYRTASQVRGGPQFGAFGVLGETGVIGGIVTPDPGIAFNMTGTDQVVFDDESGVNTPTSGYVQLGGKFYNTSTFFNMPTG